MKFDIRTIKFNNYKSFQDDFHSIEEIKNVNVFIGRNNSGKSSCVDIVQALLDVQKLKKINTKIRIGKDLSYDDLKSIFEFDLIPDSKAYRIDKRIDTYLGRYIEFDVSLYNDTLEFYNVSDVNAFPSNISWDKAGNNIRFLLFSMKFLRLNAERNIIPEQEDKTVSLYENGIGAVNVIHHILNYDNFDERFVREDLLLSLNEIMYPDSKFDGITVQKVAGGKWEVFLYEDGNRFPLSQMGSGLKTIILVLLNLLVMPYISTWPSFSTFEKKNLHYDNIVFAFEELENNLHPALQRRLFEYIYKFSIEHDS